MEALLDSVPPDLIALGVIVDLLFFAMVGKALGKGEESPDGD